MQVREREQLETIHLYVVREDDQHTPQVWLSLIPPIILLCLLVVVGVLYPYHPPLIRQTLKVPAIFLPLVRFTTSEKVIPTGVQIYPATNATGTLTITNGSIITQELPAGMLFTGNAGKEVVTIEPVTVPPSNGVTFGVATVRARAVNAGTKGNLAVLDVNLVYGTSLYIKNYRNFTGGKESYSRVFVTENDRKKAVEDARATLLLKSSGHGLTSNCREAFSGSSIVTVTWTCQFVTYHVGGHVVNARLAGSFVIVIVEKVAPVQRVTGK